MSCACVRGLVVVASTSERQADAGPRSLVAACRKIMQSKTALVIQATLIVVGAAREPRQAHPGVAC
jgi:hypothetical protein